MPPSARIDPVGVLKRNSAVAADCNFCAGEGFTDVALDSNIDKLSTRIGSVMQPDWPTLTSSLSGLLDRAEHMRMLNALQVTPGHSRIMPARSGPWKGPLPARRHGARSCDLLSSLCSRGSSGPSISTRSMPSAWISFSPPDSGDGPRRAPRRARRRLATPARQGIRRKIARGVKRCRAGQPTLRSPTFMVFAPFLPRPSNLAGRSRRDYL
jgi:hypothetical protein